MFRMDKQEDHIISSPHQAKKTPYCDLWTFVEDSFISKRNSVAVIDPLRNISLTFGELHHKIDSIASNLQVLSYSRECPLVIYMSNCAEYIMILLAVWKLGGCVATVNHLLTVEDIKEYLLLLEPEFIVCDQATASNSIQASFGTTLKKLICLGNQPGCLPFSQLYQTPKQAPRFVQAIDSKATALMAFSSGTTGRPKCVEISHRALAEVICGLVEMTGMTVCPSGGIMYQPLAHASGYAMLISYYRIGQKVILMPQFDLETFIGYVEKYKIERLLLVPPLAVLLSKSPLLQKYDLSSVRIVLCGAAPLSQDSEEELRTVLQYRAKVIQIYGMTETCAGGCAVPYYDSSAPIGSVGMLSPNTKAKVIDIETGKNLGPNQSGELCIKSNYLMNGYYKNPQATADMIQDGWLHTGDIAYYDENGYFFIVDRLKELIKYNAYQVAPSELESVLLTHPGIAEAAVTSVPDKVAGELPQAWVVLKPRVSLSEAEIQAFVAAKVAPFKKLRGGVKFVETIPKSPSGKILRRQMKQLTGASKL